MNLSEINYILKEIKKKITCPHCQKIFSNKEIHILGTNRFDGAFFIDCESCKNKLMINVFLPHMAITDINMDIEIKIVSINKNPVTKNDVLDMHNFLKELKNEDISKFIR
ncbi:hypothetical protein A2483_00750 [Candidatus Peregrinibacteria bacterium RIFOXYC2_FULL_33_13]|nr:MAG: hypothetical protein UR27_C0003G0095 [Candidatus Peregrinibacteria bacterium GW2011_GWA2_33_10]KKP40821.1 MAG: hypothetical protein UR30_C0004G0079 [Candidatus Peregrinibacteria bacterium GW2011_GWC2_33_13]OGJ48020.1 MAG: hypothetical protein A2229_03220 [Candidatus Peregrinibacteria bacterium RIFOXYA2_FULL_33_7]OGJ52410.1 MAG: hypothetical protein A2483_00750 [Candidatus Peregrinibacteria bacterium RIFOXYC2_FULL_33_13]